MPAAKRSTSKVCYHTKLRTSNVSWKKPSAEELLGKLSKIQRKQRESMRENRILAKCLASTKQELSQHSKAVRRESEIFSIHLPRVKAWIAESSVLLQKVMVNHINTVNLVNQILTPDSRLSLTPFEIAAEELTSSQQLQPPGSHHQLHASVIHEEDEEHEDAENIPPIVQRGLENVTQRPTRSAEQNLHWQSSTPTALSPNTTKPAGDSQAELQISEEVSFRMQQVTPATSTPTQHPESSPRRSPGRRQSSAASTSASTTSTAKDRKSKVNLMAATPPCLSLPESLHCSVLSDRSSNFGTAVDDQQSVKKGLQEAPSGARTSRGSSDDCTKRRSSRVVSYKEPSLSKKLRRP